MSLLLNLLLWRTHEDDPAGLLGRAFSGDRKAQEELVDRLVPVVRARVRRRVRAAGLNLDAEDLTQEVWLALCRNAGEDLRAWRPGQGATFAGYVGMLAERTVVDALRREGAEKRGRRAESLDATELPLADPNPGPEARVAEREHAARLMSHLEGQLSEMGGLVLACMYADGRSVAETAETLGVNVQVVYNWQHKIRLAARAFDG